MMGNLVGTDELFMRRALELAMLGAGAVSPNPMVGCVIVADGRIIGEGWHQRYGGPHAEVNAVANVRDKDLLKQAVVFVTLEPCSHHGKTPPCADMLVTLGVKKVVVCTIDTNPLVGGKGIAKLRTAGIEVISGILETEGRLLNKRFFTFIEKKRPFVVLKWAQTSDRFIARANLDSKWISNEYSRKLVHRWRSEEDAVLVGTTTAAYDNPALSVRDWSGRNPVRLVIDRDLKLPVGLKLFDDTQRTLLYTTVVGNRVRGAEVIKLDRENFFPEMIRDLHDKKIQSVLVEGGRQTMEMFIHSAAWDEARIFTSENSFGEGVEAPSVRGELLSREAISGDMLEIFVPGKY